MNTNWDYTDLAKTYLKRPNYSEKIIDELCRRARLRANSVACDVGAGVGNLTLMLAQRGMHVTAIEPNDAMRRHGLARTQNETRIKWFKETAENTRQESESFDIVTFGSSFNVIDRPKALVETHRILKPGGWFACMWNHRDLDDPIQSEIESIINNALTDYCYGVRREDQSAVIDSSGLFDDIIALEGQINHSLPVADVVEAWRSHATLARQAGARFEEIVDRIEGFLRSLSISEIPVPYTTRLWAAMRR